MGMRIALTQAKGRLEGLDDRLAALGHEVVRVPLVETVPLTDMEAQEAAAALLGLPWRLYASRSAVEAWLELGLGLADGARLGAVGPGTARALARAGAPDVLVGERSTAAGLAQAVVAVPGVRGPVGVVQGRRARSTLRDALAAAGFEPRVATVYDTQPQVWRGNEGVDVVVLASPSAVAALPRHVGDGAVLVAIGPTTARAMRERGWRGIEAERPTAEGVLQAVRSARAPQRRRTGAGATEAP
jgi:uroporphyrinogen-III synthase